MGCEEIKLKHGLPAESGGQQVKKTREKTEASDAALALAFGKVGLQDRLREGNATCGRGLDYGLLTGHGQISGTGGIGKIKTRICQLYGSEMVFLCIL